MRSPLVLASLTDPAGDSPTPAIGTAVFYGTVSLLLFGPLAFGAVEPWSMFILEAGSALLFVLWVIWQSASGELDIVGSPLFIPMLLFAILIGVQLAAGQTAYAYATRSNALLYCAYGLLCFLIVQCLRRTYQVKILAWILSGYGFAVASFALIQSFDSDGQLYWYRTPRSGGWIYGPYVNHNHYAGLMEMLLPIPLVIAFSHHVPRTYRRLAGGAAALIASTIFLCGSRGGMVALAIEIAIFSAVLIYDQKGRKLALTLGGFFVIVAGILTWLGGGELTDRLASIQSETRTELAGGIRLNIDRDGMKMFAQKPILGWGLGVFPTVYPQHRSFYTNDVVNEAHNDYVQLLVETGGIGFIIMLWFLVLTYSRAITKLEDWTKSPNGAVALAAMLGITGILVHSFVDFNLQVPANAAIFYVLCVLATMDPRFRSYSRTRTRRPRPEMDNELSA